MSRVRVLGLLAAVVAIAVAGVLVLTGGDDGAEKAAAACPAGQVRVPDRGEGESSVLIGGPVKSEAEREREEGEEKDRDKGEKGKDKGEAGDYEANFKGKCAPASHPESSRDL